MVLRFSAADPTYSVAWAGGPEVTIRLNLSNAEGITQNNLDSAVRHFLDRMHTIVTNNNGGVAKPIATVSKNLAASADDPDWTYTPPA